MRGLLLSLKYLKYLGLIGRRSKERITRPSRRRVTQQRRTNHEAQPSHSPHDMTIYILRIPHHDPITHPRCECKKISSSFEQRVRSQRRSLHSIFDFARGHWLRTPAGAALLVSLEVTAHPPVRLVRRDASFVHGRWIRWSGSRRNANGRAS